MEVTRKLMAVLEADVVGYSRMVAEDDVATARTLEDRWRLFEPYTGQRGGQILNKAGDAILIVFNSALSAVESAITIQRDFNSRNKLASTDFIPMHFRMGIDLGDVLVQNDQPTSTVANTAARLKALADPGGVCISGAVYGQIHGKTDVEFEDCGDHDLKGIPLPVRVFKASVGSSPAGEAENQPGATRLGSYIPTLRRRPTDRDWNRFMRESFDTIQTHFRRTLRELERKGDSVETDFDAVDTRRFICRVYVDGKLEAEAKIWLGSMLGAGQQIYFSTNDVEREGDNSWNECIHPPDDRGQLALSAMGMAMGPTLQGFDRAHLSPQEAAEYLWRVFTQYLG